MELEISAWHMWRICMVCWWNYSYPLESWTTTFPEAFPDFFLCGKHRKWTKNNSQWNRLRPYFRASLYSLLQQFISFLCAYHMRMLAVPRRALITLHSGSHNKSKSSDCMHLNTIFFSSFMIPREIAGSSLVPGASGYIVDTLWLPVAKCLFKL